MSHIPPFMKRKARFVRPQPAAQPAPAPEPEAPANVEEAVAEMEKPKVELPYWNSKMKKDALLKIAKKAGLKVSKENTKNEIVDALKSL